MPNFIFKNLRCVYKFIPAFCGVPGITPHSCSCAMSNFVAFFYMKDVKSCHTVRLISISMTLIQLSTFSILCAHSCFMKCLFCVHVFFLFCWNAFILLIHYILDTYLLLSSPCILQTFYPSERLICLIHLGCLSRNENSTF